MRARATALISALLAILSLAAAARSHNAQAEPAAVNAAGAVQVGNSKNGSAILSGALGPGDSLSGTVTISNIGSAAGDFTLSLSHLTDTPGPSGGFFSRQLDLVVSDVTAPAAPVTVYSGRLNSLNPTTLGAFAAGAARKYRFVVSWAAAAGDPTMYGSSMSVEFDWLAGDASTAPPPTSPAPAPIAPPAAPGAPPAPLTAPRLGLTMPRSQRVLKRRTVIGSATCDGPCAIVAAGSISVPGATRSYKLVTSRRTLDSPGRATLKLRLPRNAFRPLRSALKKHRRVLAPITVTATGTSGTVTNVHRKVRITG